MKDNTGNVENSNNTDFETLPVGTMDQIDKLKEDLIDCNKILDIYRNNVTRSGDANLISRIEKQLSELNQQEVFIDL